MRNEEGDAPKWQHWVKVIISIDLNESITGMSNPLALRGRDDIIVLTKLQRCTFKNISGVMFLKARDIFHGPDEIR